MIPRYSRPQMAAIWAPENRFRIWLEIEALACEAQAELGVIPESAARAVRERGAFEGIEREREGDTAFADRQLVDVGRRGDERDGRRDQHVDLPHRLAAAVPVLGPEAPRDLHLLVRDLHAALYLAAGVLAVLVGPFREETPVDVRDLAHEQAVFARVVQRQVDGLTVRKQGEHVLDARTDKGVRVLEPGEADA